MQRGQEEELKPRMSHFIHWNADIKVLALCLINSPIEDY